MEIIDYKTVNLLSGKEGYKTDCPHHINYYDEDNDVEFIIKVGSSGCQKCQYHAGLVMNKKSVVCKLSLTSL